MMPGQYILVVDDDEAFREALSEVLVEAGYPVQKAENGEVALQRVTDEAPGIVLLDLKMPVLDGWGVMERMPGGAVWWNTWTAPHGEQPLLSQSPAFSGQIDDRNYLFSDGHSAYIHR